MPETTSAPRTSAPAAGGRQVQRHPLTDESGAGRRPHPLPGCTTCAAPWGEPCSRRCVERLGELDG